MCKQFNEAAEKVKTLTKKPTDDELLELYSLYKQGTIGDNDTEKPSLLELKAKRKWESWKSKSGISKEDAQQSYINYAKSLVSKYSQ
ncbi:hypothetical protein PGB90_007578 [Kerria lacca]